MSFNIIASSYGSKGIAYKNPGTCERSESLRTGKAFKPLTDQETSVHGQQLTGDVARCGAGEEQQGVGDVLRFTHAT